MRSKQQVSCMASCGRAMGRAVSVSVSALGELQTTEPFRLSFYRVLLILIFFRKGACAVWFLFKSILKGASRRAVGRGQAGRGICLPVSGC